MNVLKLTTLTLASARLTRFVISDKLGRWLIQEPIEKAADKYAQREIDRAQAENREPVTPWWWKYQEGLQCQWCVGFWLTLGTLGVERVTRNSPMRPALEVFAGALAMNYANATLLALNPAEHGDDGDGVNVEEDN